MSTITLSPGTTAGVRSPAPHPYHPLPAARSACSFRGAFLKSPAVTAEFGAVCGKGRGSRDRREAPPVPSWLRLPHVSDPQITVYELQTELGEGNHQARQHQPGKSFTITSLPDQPSLPGLIPLAELQFQRCNNM